MINAKGIVSYLTSELLRCYTAPKILYTFNFHKCFKKSNYSLLCVRATNRIINLQVEMSSELFLHL